MAERIPQSFIDDLVSRTDIVDLIDSYIQLKKTGSNYSARCPFHDEKTPSFTVSPDKQFYHCFGCGAHGTAIGFLMDYERLGFLDAIEVLANRAGMQIPRTKTLSQESHSSTDYELLEQCNAYFQRQLRNHQNAIDYLKQRGLTGETAKRFNIGFAPPGWNNLLDNLGKTTQQQQQLLELGLIVKNDQNKQYDRFRNRVIFPIRDTRGRTIAFGGRVIDSNESPKYLNSPESAAFHKGKELYGLWEAKQAHRRLDKILIVEGYMDVVMLGQQGINYAVATLGTAATANHVERLFRNTNEIIFCFDGDQAGRTAALRALQHTLPAMKEGHQARFMFLPDGEDPDSLVQQVGSEGFEELILKSMTLSEFFFHHLKEQTNVKTMDGRARLVELARPLLNTIPEGVYKLMLADELAKIAKMETTTLKSNLGISGQSPNQPLRQASAKGGAQTPMSRAITLLLQQPKLASEISTPNWLDQCKIPGANLLLSLIEILHERPNLTTAGLLEMWRDSEHGPSLFKLARKEILTPENGLAHEFLGALNRIQENHAEQRAEYLLQKEPGELTPDERTELAEALAQGKHAVKREN